MDRGFLDGELEHRKVTPMNEDSDGNDDKLDFVTVLTSDTAFSLEPAKSLLEQGGVMSIIRRESVSAACGLELPLNGGGPELRVPSNAQEEAEKILCENGYVCQVSGDAVDRVMKRVIRPAVESGTFDGPDILRLLSNQPSDFRLPVFEATVGLDGGPSFLIQLLSVSLIQGVDPEEESVRRDLSRILGRSHTDAAASEVSKCLVDSTDIEARKRIARTLGRFDARECADQLVSLLDDEDRAVREEALDALYFRSGGRSFGFKSDEEPELRALAVKKWERWAKSV